MQTALFLINNWAGGFVSFPFFFFSFCICVMCKMHHTVVTASFVYFCRLDLKTVSSQKNQLARSGQSSF